MGNDVQRETRPPANILVEIGDVNGDGKHGNVFCRLHDKHGNKSEKIQINSLLNFQARKQLSCPCSFTIHAVEIWIEPIFGVRECYLKQVEVDSSPFPINRWLRASDDTPTTPAYIPKYGSVLPQDDKDKSNRIKVIEGNREWFTPVERVDGFSSLSQKVPPGEEFQTDYQEKILENALGGKVQKVGDDVVDFLNPFDDDTIEEFTDYGQCYTGMFEMVPKGYKHWQSDRRFAMQRLIGVNPNVIELCQKLPEKFNGTPEQLEPLLEGLSLKEALENKKIFVVNYEILEDLTTASQLYAPIAIFYVNKKDHLLPLAIQLQQSPTAEVHLPTDPSNSWLVAKMLFNVADANYHETITHLGFTHLIAESILVSLQQALAPSHPISMLLRPHFLYLMSINAAAFKILVNPGGFFDSSLAVGSTGYKELLAKRFKTWSLGIDGNLPADLKRRGVDDPNVLPGYHYREDGLDLYNAIYKYVKEIVSHVYAGYDGKFDENKFKDDNEIHAWAKTMLGKDFNMKNIFNASIEEGFKDLESVIKTVTTTIFICSVQHAAVNFGQYDQYGFPPNYPSKMKNIEASTNKMNISERNIVKLLPTFNEAMDVLTITNTLSMRATQPLGYFEEEYLQNPSALKAVNNFQTNLSKIGGRIKLRNAERSFPYEYLEPSLIPNAISI